MIDYIGTTLKGQNSGAGNDFLASVKASPNYNRFSNILNSVKSENGFDRDSFIRLALLEHIQKPGLEFNAAEHNLFITKVINYPSEHVTAPEHHAQASAMRALDPNKTGTMDKDEFNSLNNYLSNRGTHIDQGMEAKCDFDGNGIVDQKDHRALQEVRNVFLERDWSNNSSPVPPELDDPGITLPGFPSPNDPGITLPGFPSPNPPPLPNALVSDVQILNDFILATQRYNDLEDNSIHTADQLLRRDRNTTDEVMNRANHFLAWPIDQSMLDPSRDTRNELAELINERMSGAIRILNNVGLLQDMYASGQLSRHDTLDPSSNPGSEFYQEPPQGPVYGPQPATPTPGAPLTAAPLTPPPGTEVNDNEDTSTGWDRVSFITDKISNYNNSAQDSINELVEQMQTDPNFNTSTSYGNLKAEIGQSNSMRDFWNTAKDFWTSAQFNHSTDSTRAEALLREIAQAENEIGQIGVYNGSGEPSSRHEIRQQSAMRRLEALKQSFDSIPTIPMR